MFFNAFCGLWCFRGEKNIATKTQKHQISPKNIRFRLSGINDELSEIPLYYYYKSVKDVSLFNSYVILSKINGLTFA
jgi:hypothetical protein